MADVLTIDPRKTVFGNKRVITGTIALDGSGTTYDLDLSDDLSEVEGIMVNATGSTVRAAVTNSINGTEVKLGALVASVTYSFVAIGER
jgi:hypothetical protein